MGSYGSFISVGSLRQFVKCWYVTHFGTALASVVADHAGHEIALEEEECKLKIYLPLCNPSNLWIVLILRGCALTWAEAVWEDWGMLYKSLGKTEKGSAPQ